MISVHNPSFLSIFVFKEIIGRKQWDFRPLLKWFSDNHCIEMVMRSQRATGKYIRDRIEDNDLWTRFLSFLTDEYSVGDWKGTTR